MHASSCREFSCGYPRWCVSAALLFSVLDADIGDVGVAAVALPMLWLLLPLLLLVVVVSVVMVVAVAGVSARMMVVVVRCGSLDGVDSGGGFGGGGLL